MIQSQKRTTPFTASCGSVTDRAVGRASSASTPTHRPSSRGTRVEVRSGSRMSRVRWAQDAACSLNNMCETVTHRKGGMSVRRSNVCMGRTSAPLIKNWGWQRHGGRLCSRCPRKDERWMLAAVNQVNALRDLSHQCAVTRRCTLTSHKVWMCGSGVQWQPGAKVH